MIPASRVVQPSLFLLLVIIAVILVSYGAILDSPPERLAGIALAACSLVMLRPIARNTPAPLNERRYRVTAESAVPPRIIESPVRAGGLSLRVLPLVLLAAGCSAATVYRINAMPQPDAGRAALSALIGTVESVRMQRYTSEIVVRQEKTPGAPGGMADGARVLIMAPHNTAAQRGDECAVFSEARPVTMEGVRESSFLRGLARRGLTYTAYADEDSLSIVRTAPEGTRGIIRSGIARSLDRHFRARTASLLKALYFGNKNHMDKRTIEQYKKAGVMHVLAASGLHVGIVAAIPFMLLAPLRVGKTAILAVTIALLCFYLYITDMPVSLVRAFMMFAAYAVLRLFDMDRGAVNTLLLTASAILILMPHELYEPGFQLTFGATLGILLFYRSFEACLDLLPMALRGPLALTLAAQIPVYPIILYHMNEVNLAGIVSNLAAVPGITLALSVSIAAQAAGLLSETAARVLAVPVDITVEATGLFVQAMASLGGLFRVECRSWALLPFYALYLLPLVATREKRRMAVLAVPLAVVGAWFVLSSDAVRPGAVRIAYHDTGRMLILSNGSHALLHGRLSGIEEAKAVFEILERERVETLQLALTGTDFHSLSAACFLARRCVISACAIDSGFRFSRALSRLVAVLERDGVMPEFLALPRLPAGCADERHSMALFSPPVREYTLPALAALAKRLHAYGRPGHGEPDSVRSSH